MCIRPLFCSCWQQRPRRPRARHHLGYPIIGPPTPVQRALRDGLRGSVCFLADHDDTLDPYKPPSKTQSSNQKGASIQDAEFQPKMSLHPRYRVPTEKEPPSKIQSPTRKGALSGPSRKGDKFPNQLIHQRSKNPGGSGGAPMQLSLFPCSLSWHPLSQNVSYLGE